MATASDLYDLACYDYAEDGGLVLDVVTSGQFFDTLNLQILDWFRQTALIQRIYTQAVVSGQGLYTFPNDILRPDGVFLAGKWLPRATQQQLNGQIREWRVKTGEPQFFYTDGLPVKTIGLAPVPNYSGQVFAPVYDTFNSAALAGNGPGVHRGLTIIGPRMPAAALAAPANTIPLIPDEIALGYLLFGVHEKIFSGDNELQETQRAQYCAAQWKEGIAVAQAIAGEAEAEE